MENKLFLITIICCFINCITSSKSQLKWFAYCHFLKGESYIEMLSCGKCLVLDQLKFNHQNQRILNENQIQSKYCSYYYTKLGIHQHTLNRDEEELALIPNLSFDWFNSDLFYLIEKKEISTNLDDFLMFNLIPINLKIIELVNFGIESVSQNAFKQFKNLRILSLAFNSLKSIDLAPFQSTDIIEIDLSFNQIANIKKGNFSLDNLRLLNISNNNLDYFDMKSISSASKLQILDLSNNYLKELKLEIATDLIYLNLNSNYLKNFNDFFINKTDMNCNMKSIDIYINDNKWDCDCDSYNLYKKISSKEYNESCLFNFISNSYLICDSNMNWPQWNTLNCAETESNKTIKQTTPIQSTQFYFIWHSSATIVNRQQNLTTKMLKYDISTAFYWVSSFCVATITISCLFIVWFYCFKRFRISRQIGLIPINRPRNYNRQHSRQDVSRFAQQRNIYVVNPQVNNPNPDMLIRNQNNNTYPMAIYRHFRQRNDPSDLYFISLTNRNANGFQNNLSGQHDNLAYVHGDDEPPSYYDAILVKNNRLSIAKDEPDERATNLNVLRNNGNSVNSELNDEPILALTNTSIAASILFNQLESELSEDSLETRTDQLN